MDYDDVGNKTFETDVHGSRTEYGYDGLYRVNERRLPTDLLNHIERFKYDKAGNKLSESDANGNETRYVYDRLNRLVERTDAVGNVVSYVYDEAGNVLEEQDVTRGLRTETDYDGLNRPLERRTIGEAPNGFTYLRSYRYDDGAHSVTETDPRGFETTTYLDGFDRVHRMEQETGSEILVTTNAYDANGNLRETEDAAGHVTSYAYDGLNRLERVDFPLGLSASFVYDGEGNKTEEVNRRGLATTFSYDNLGRLTETSMDQPITGGPPVVTSIDYDDTFRRRLETDGRGNPTTYEMDEQGRVTKIIDAVGEEQIFEYDGVNKRREEDKRDHETEYDYDGLNRLTLVRNALDQEVVTVYDDAARTVTETDRRNVVKTTLIDAAGRLISVTRSGAVLEQHEYDGNNNRVLSTDANGNQTRFSYDGANRLIARTDALATLLATTTTFAYDRVGNLEEEKDGRVTGKPFDVRNTYDDLNRLIAVEDAEGNVTTFEYDGEGNRTVQVEPKGGDHVTELAYGELNELIRVDMADGGAYQYDYDENRNRTRQTDAEGNVVEFTYDALNRVETMTQDPGGLNFVTDHDYDPNGNEIRLTDPKGQVIEFTYDELDRLETKTYHLTAADFELLTRTHAITYHYDQNDNLVQVDELKSSGLDPPGTVSSFKSYDALDRLESETDAWGRTLTYGYDPQGNRTSLTDPDSVRTEYAFDELNRLETLTLEAGTAGAQVVTYDYLPNGLKRRVINPNGTTSNYNYDAASRMTSITHTSPTGVVSAYAYSYDPNGNRTRQIETNAGRTETTLYDYDFVNRLKTVTYEAGTTTANQVSYTYDQVGNRLTERTVQLEGSVLTKDLTYDYDAINRLETITDNLDASQSSLYAYDANGNTRSKTKAGVTTEFKYDIRNQLGEVLQGASTLGRYGYDYEGLRILKIGNDGRRHYTYDQLSVVTEATQLNVTVSKYDYGLDQLVSLNNTAEGRSFFHLDFLGSTANLTDAFGGTRQSILYDAWGNERDRVGVSANNFTFTGHEKDEETGLIYAKARFYDPDIGRFLNQDRLLGILDDPPSLHRFAYVSSNPTRFVDITGLSGEDVRVLNEIYSAPWQMLGREVDALRADIDRAIDAGKEQARYSAVLGLRLLARMWEMGPGNAGHVTPEWAAENYVQPENDVENVLFQLQDLALIVGPLARPRGGASTPRSGSLSRTSTVAELEAASLIPETTRLSTPHSAPRSNVAAVGESPSTLATVSPSGSPRATVVTESAGSRSAEVASIGSPRRVRTKTDAAPGSPEHFETRYQDHIANNPGKAKTREQYRTIYQRNLENQRGGARREQATIDDLQLQHPNARITSHRQLLDRDGNKLRGPDGTGRELDHVVIQDGKVIRLLETTAESAPKTSQMAKEQAIREGNAGNVHIRDPETGDLIQVPDDMPNEIVRRR